MAQGEVVASGGRARRRSRIAFAALAAAVMAGISGGVVYFAEPASSSSYAFVDAGRVPLHGHAPTVRSVLAAAHRQVHDGVLKAAVSGRVLDAHYAPGAVLVRGEPVGLTAAVRPNDELTVVDGTDRVEGTVLRDVPVPPPPLPDVERTLWHPGVAGVAEAEVGVVSGEVVHELRVVTPATPPHPETGKVVALTFDDGPSPQWTPAILALLAEKQVHAMFCLVGYAVRWMPQMPKTEVDQGHTLCNHTGTHVEHLDTKPHDQIVGEIGRGANAITDALGGTRPLFYRPPGGSLSAEVIGVAHDHGERVITWSIDPDDFRHPPARVLLERILSHVGPGSIILLHDGGGDRSQTLAVLGPLIDALRAQGYTFATPFTS